ncbi:hypothetical protein HDU76_010281 [Blyttiomyces sp. JEL0837]|nr:hypothetical protein HDU76_010281 [Blyttiomyces sp. JEL0837]
MTSRVYLSIDEEVSDFFNKRHYTPKDFALELPHRMRIVRALTKRDAQLRQEKIAKSLKSKSKEEYKVELGDWVWLSIPLRSEQKTDANEDPRPKKFMYRWAGPMKVTAISKDGNRLQLVEHLADTSILPGIANVARVKPYYGVPLIDSADEAAIGTSLDDFEQEVQDWKNLRIRKRKANVKVTVGISRELLRRYDPLFAHDDPEDKQYYVEKLDSHEYNDKTKEYSYHVKWLGYDDNANLLLPETEISQAIISDYWEMVRLRSPAEYRKRVAFAKKYPKKITQKSAPSPAEKTTEEDNEGFDSDSDEESNFEVVIPKLYPEEDWITS